MTNKMLADKIAIQAEQMKEQVAGYQKNRGYRVFSAAAIKRRCMEIRQDALELMCRIEEGVKDDEEE